MANRKETLFTGYSQEREQGLVLCFLTVDSETPAAGKPSFPSRLQAGEEAWVVLDKTCFYPEGGGPSGDRGWLVHPKAKAQIVDTQKRAGLIFHHTKVKEGTLHQGYRYEVTVDSEYRKETARSHSATHLLNQALRDVLGSTVRQMGSLVRPGELRFDFSCPHPLRLSQITEVENKVLREIESAHPVASAVEGFQEVKGQGALFLAGENYPPSVRTIRMGKSFELCGGIHVKNTSEVGGFKIISETGVQSGVRRLTAYTGDTLKKWQKLIATDARELYEHLSHPPPPAPITFPPSPLKGNGTEKLKTFRKEDIKPPSACNPFIHWLERVDRQIQMVQDRLKNLNPLPAGAINLSSKNPSEAQGGFTNEAQMIKHSEELYRYLKIPFPKVQGKGFSSQGRSPSNFLRKTNPFISLFQKKSEEFQSAAEQLQNLRAEDRVAHLVGQAVLVPCPGAEGVHLLTQSLPLRDGKILAEVADRLKSRLPPRAVVVLLGGSKNPQSPASYPIVVGVSSPLQDIVPAGSLLKKMLAPLLNGKGGGSARFARGTIKDKSRFFEACQTLQKHIKNLSPSPPAA